MLLRQQGGLEMVLLRCASGERAVSDGQTTPAGHRPQSRAWWRHGRSRGGRVVRGCGPDGVRADGDVPESQRDRHRGACRHHARARGAPCARGGPSSDVFGTTASSASPFKSPRWTMTGVASQHGCMRVEAGGGGDGVSGHVPWQRRKGPGVGRGGCLVPRTHAGDTGAAAAAGGGDVRGRRATYASLCWRACGRGTSGWPSCRARRVHAAAHRCQDGGQGEQGGAGGAAMLVLGAHAEEPARGEASRRESMRTDAMMRCDGCARHDQTSTRRRLPVPVSRQCPAQLPGCPKPRVALAFGPLTSVPCASAERARLPLFPPSLHVPRQRRGGEHGAPTTGLDGEKGMWSFPYALCLNATPAGSLGPAVGSPWAAGDAAGTRCAWRAWWSERTGRLASPVRAYGAACVGPQSDTGGGRGGAIMLGHGQAQRGGVSKAQLSEASRRGR